jgi:hypothetical protein
MYAIEVKAAPEGRRDRLVPLWAQAHLQAVRAAQEGGRAPLAVVVAPRVPVSVAEELERFAAECAPGAALGVVDFAGFSRFRGLGLEGLDAEAHESADVRRLVRPKRVGSADLFTDLNQWMLKVLLAPELPQHLLAAPRGQYRNASQLARAAGASAMSASRFLRQLEREGYLDKSASRLRLVRREALFDAWQASAGRRVEELPMRFLVPGNPQAELQRILREHHEEKRACLGLFAAAEALGLGIVAGVPPHVYVPRLELAVDLASKNVVPVEPGEMPAFILRQPSAPASVFHGAVNIRGVWVSDVLQIWLDAASNPSRGEEQADFIRRKVLFSVIRPEGY